MSRSSIPEEIQEEILLRLPVKSILTFKSVCKSWYTYITSPKFAKDHLRITTNQNSRIMIRDSPLGVYKYMFYSANYASILSASTSLSLGTCECDGAVLMDNPTVKINNGVEEIPFVIIWGSCNGLLCLGTHDSDILILWNPSTKEYKEIMLPADIPWFNSYGFGYDSQIDDYKLVSITLNEVYAYTLGSNSWRRVNTIPDGYFCELAGLLLNGALHWPCTTTTNKIIKAILAYDISSNKIINLPFPEEITLLSEGCCYLRALGDSLCIVFGVSNVRVDVWVMKDYGVRESWIKQFTTTQKLITRCPYSLKPYWSFENGEILIQVPEGLVFYDQKNDRIRFLKFNGIGRFTCVLSESYVESLVSLNF